VLRSEVELLRAKLRDSEAQKDSYHNSLVALENRLERSQSAIVHEVESKGKSQEQECGSDTNEEALRKPPSPLVSGLVLSRWWESIFMHFLHFLTLLQQSSAVGTPIIQNNGCHDVPSELQVLQDQLNARDAKIVELEKEAAVLRDEKTMMQLEVGIFQVVTLNLSHEILCQFKAPSHEQLLQNPSLIRLLDHIASQELTLAEKTEENRRLGEELQQLQSQLTSQAEVWETDKVCLL
jgi:E3 ubiquitin-protein ligase BRE1